MKYSRQREKILGIVMEYRIHPTADDVYTMMKQELPNISLGTVYRNLNLLSQTGDIRKICIPNGSDRFDGRLDHHYHMICRECGSVSDIEFDFTAQIDRMITEQTGFVVTGHELIVRGVCPDCQKNGLSENQLADFT